MDTRRLDYRQYPVLMVDDEVNNLEVFRLQFRRKFDVRVVGSALEALEYLRRGEVEPAVVIADQRMPGCTGIDLLRQITELAPGVIGIILTAYSDWDVLLQALHSGIVYRYLNKPWKQAEMEIIIRQAIERYALEQDNRRLVKQMARMNEYLQDELKHEQIGTRIVGREGGLSALFSRAMQVATTPSTVLLRGESGSGKEVIARAIHEASPRASGPFIKVSCAALSPNLLESELFGHEKGAFTGASSMRPGRFELANRGTIFLDEVGELSPELQVKLLRVLQEREFERVGGQRTLQLDVRVISATHRDLEALIKEGRFREDLYYRLNVFPLYIPPLRDRVEDIPDLVEHFVERLCARARRPSLRVRPETLERLKRWPWPGNVRELQNVIERAVIVSLGEWLEVEDALGGLEGSSADAPAVAASLSPGVVEIEPELGQHLDDMLFAYERKALLAALERAAGNKATAARLLGLSRPTLYYRLRRHNLLDEDEK